MLLILRVKFLFKTYSLDKIKSKYFVPDFVCSKEMSLYSETQ